MEVVRTWTKPISNEAPAGVQEVLDAVAEICRRYEITALQDFLASCRSSLKTKSSTLLFLGRFKAGKSSFLNHLIGRPLLPVGVIPITSAVTEIQYGAEERADVKFQDGHTEQVPLAQISEFISEAENPENAKGVACVRVELPSMERYRGIRFVDTPVWIAFSSTTPMRRSNGCPTWVWHWSRSGSIRHSRSMISNSFGT